MKHSNRDLARSVATRSALLLLLFAGAAGAAIASCDDTGPSPIGNHPDDAEVDSSVEEDASDDGGEGGEGEGGDAGEGGEEDDAGDAAKGDAGADAADAADADGG